VTEHCDESKNLLRTWEATLTLLSKVATRIAQSEPSADGHAKLLHESELAEAKVERARIAYGRHKEEHGCR